MPSRPSNPRSRDANDSATSRVARTSPSRTSQGISDVEPDLEDVAVLDLVVLAFDAELADFLGLVPRTEVEQLVPADDLGADEAALQVGVDHAGALGRLRTGAERPRPRLLVARRQERAQAQQEVRGASDARQHALPQTEPFEQLGAFVVRELRGLRFELHADAEHLG